MLKVGLSYVHLPWSFVEFIVTRLCVFGIVEIFTFNTNVSTHGHPYKLHEVHHNRLNVIKQFLLKKRMN